MGGPPDMPPGAGALIGACRALYAAIDKLDHEATIKVGVSRNDLRALNLLEHGPVRAGALAEGLGLTSGAVSTLIDRLERRGLARRIPDPDDRRAIRVAPTPKLFEALAPLDLGVALRVGALAATLDPEELAVAKRVLFEVARAYRDAADSPPPGPPAAS